MRDKIKFKILLLIATILLGTDLCAEKCNFPLPKVDVEWWLCTDGISEKKYTCKTVEWDENINGEIVHRTTIIVIFYCCDWDESTKTLNTTVQSIWFRTKIPPFSVSVAAIINEVLTDTKKQCKSDYPACDDPNVPHIFKQKISFPSCWYYKNSQPFVGDDFILSLVKCEGSNCVSTYEVCTDYSAFPYKIVENLVSKIVEGFPCTTTAPELPPENSPLWQQNWSTGCFLFNNCN